MRRYTSNKQERIKVGKMLTIMIYVGDNYPSCFTHNIWQN